RIERHVSYYRCWTTAGLFDVDVAAEDVLRLVDAAYGIPTVVVPQIFFKIWIATTHNEESLRVPNPVKIIAYYIPSHAKGIGRGHWRLDCVDKIETKFAVLDQNPVVWRQNTEPCMLFRYCTHIE